MLKQPTKLLLFLILLAGLSANAQVFPIQANTQLVPPYSVYLPDYATGINNQLRVVLLNRDMTQPSYTIKLRMSIELNGSLIIRTSDYYNPSPVTLQPNQPYSVEGLELAPYLNSNNIDFIGISKQEYEEKKGLPDGSYKICFTAYDYNRPDWVKVSNEGCSYYYLTKNDPPFINTPACGEYIISQQAANENLIDLIGNQIQNNYGNWNTARKNEWYNAAAPLLMDLLQNNQNDDEIRARFFALICRFSPEGYGNKDPYYNANLTNWIFDILATNETRVLTKNYIKTSSSVTWSYPYGQSIEGYLINQCGKHFCDIFNITWNPTVQNIWGNTVGPFISQLYFQINDRQFDDFWQMRYAYVSGICNYGIEFLTAINYPGLENDDVWEGFDNFGAFYFNTPFVDAFSYNNFLKINTILQPVTAGNSNIVFSWTPRHISSPNSTLSTRYKVELFEVIPSNSDPNAVVLSTVPVFTDETTLTSYAYGPDKPALVEGYTYAWRVKAFDANGRDWFKNNGYSEVCSFSFVANNPLGGIGGSGPPPVQSIVATGIDTRQGEIHWQASNTFQHYRVQYRKKDGTGTWFMKETDSTYINVFDLEPSTIYEARVQGKAGLYYGPVSSIDTMLTLAPVPPPGCGLAINYGAGLSQVPLPTAEAVQNMFIKIGKFEMQIDSIGSSGSPGYFNGKGRITDIPFLAILQLVGNAAGNNNSNGGLKVTFNNVFVNINREITTGEVYAVSRPLDEWLGGFDAYYEERRIEQQQRDNRRAFSLDSNAITLGSNMVIVDVIIDTVNHIITMVGPDGTKVTYVLKPEEIGKEVLIEDKNGNQWIVRKDGKVEFVNNGGLNPRPAPSLTSGETDILKLALKKLKIKYNIDTLNILENKMNLEKGNANNYVKQKYDALTNSEPQRHDASEVMILGSSTKLIQSGTQEFNLISNYEKAARDYNVGKTANLFARETNTQDELQLIASYLKPENKSFKDFVAQKISAGVTSDAIAGLLKTELDNLIKTIIDARQ